MIKSEIQVIDLFSLLDRIVRFLNGVYEIIQQYLLGIDFVVFIKSYFIIPGGGGGGGGKESLY